MGEVLRLTKDKAMDPEQVSFSPKHLADLLVMVEKSEVSPQNAKKVFEKVFEEDIDPVAYIEEHGLKIVEDTGLLEETINRIWMLTQDHFQNFWEVKIKSWASL